MDKQLQDFFNEIVQRFKLNADDLLWITNCIYRVYGLDVSTDDFLDHFEQWCEGYGLTLINADPMQFRELINWIAEEKDLKPWEIVFLARPAVRAAGGFNSDPMEFLVQFRIRAAFRQAEREHPEWNRERVIYHGPSDSILYGEETS